MALVTVEIEPGETITIIAGHVYEIDDEPPGEEAPEEPEHKHIRAVGE